MQLGEMQAFIGVNVAKPGKEGLVEEQGLERATAFVQVFKKPLGGEPLFEWFGSQLAEDLFRLVCQPYAPKLARVVECQVCLYRKDAKEGGRVFQA